MSVRRQCQSWSIERGNLWKGATSINLVLVSETCIVFKISFLQPLKLEKDSQHELQAARAEQERKILQEELWRQQQDFREVHQQNLTEMKELQKFQSCTFNTLTRQKFIEDQNTIMELSGRLQELQNEVNCMSDSKDFQDVEILTLPVNQDYSLNILLLRDC